MIINVQLQMQHECEFLAVSVTCYERASAECRTFRLSRRTELLHGWLRITHWEKK